MKPFSGLPEEVVNRIRTGIVSQFATMSSAGVPIDTPSLYFPSEDLATIDLATGLAYPAKAERARKNPKVGLLIEGMPDQPVVSIAGLAAVADADLQMNAERYLAETAYTLPGGVSWEVARPAIWYWTRIIIKVAPQTVRWWDSPAAMDSAPHVWRAPADTPIPASDPAPAGAVSAAPNWGQRPWREQARGMLEMGAPGHLTLADSDGFPLPIQARGVELGDDGFVLDIPAGAPWGRQGKATFTFEGRATFVGEVSDEGGKARFVVERALPALPLATDPRELWAPAAETFNNLMRRLTHEAERRGRPLPVLPEQLPPFTAGAQMRMAAIAAMGGPGLSGVE